MTGTQYGTWQELRFCLHRRGWSQTVLAKEARVSRSYISQLHNGLRWPSEKITRKLSDALGVHANVLRRSDATRRNPPEALPASRDGARR